MTSYLHRKHIHLSATSEIKIFIIRVILYFQAISFILNTRTDVSSWLIILCGTFKFPTFFFLYKKKNRNEKKRKENLLSKTLQLGQLSSIVWIFINTEDHHHMTPAGEEQVFWQAETRCSIS